MKSEYFLVSGTVYYFFAGKEKDIKQINTSVLVAREPRQGFIRADFNKYEEALCLNLLSFFKEQTEHDKNFSLDEIQFLTVSIINVINCGIHEEEEFSKEEDTHLVNIKNFDEPEIHEETEGMQ